MFDLKMINMRSIRPGEKYPPEPVPLTENYRKKLDDELKKAGVIERLDDELKKADIKERERFFADIEQAMGHYRAAKKLPLISPAMIRKAHLGAVKAVKDAQDKLCDLYDIGKSDYEGSQRESSHQDSMADMLDYLGSMTPEIEALPDRIPKTFHERDLARMVALAMPPQRPEHLSATIESIFEEVLRIVFEIVEYTTGNIHRMASRTLQDYPPIWIEAYTNKCTKRGVKKKRS